MRFNLDLFEQKREEAAIRMARYNEQIAYSITTPKLGISISNKEI